MIIFSGRGKRLSLSRELCACQSQEAGRATAPGDCVGNRDALPTPW